VRTLLRRLAYLLRRSRLERDLTEEMETHRLLRQASLERRGLSRAAAEQGARTAMGNLTLAGEECRATWRSRLAEQLTQDVRYAVRGLRRTPGFSLAALAMLTLGLGLVAGGYSVFNGLFHRGWDVPDSDEVFVVYGSRPATTGTVEIRDGFSLGAFRRVSAGARLADFVASRAHYFSIRTAESDRSIPFTGGFVSANFIETLRIPMALGTGRVAARSGEPPRIVISDAVWRRLFGSDPAVVGRTAWVGDVPVVVGGVTTPAFSGLGPNPLAVMADITAAPSFRQSSASAVVADDSACCVDVAGRMRPGQQRASVQAEVELLVGRYRHEVRQPPLSVAVAETTLGQDLGRSERASSLGAVLALIGAGFALVFILTCANVGNLYLARSFRREREIAMRLALGAGRARIVRQLLTEGMVLAALAGAGAFGVAAGVPLLLWLIEDNVTVHMFAADWRVASVTAGAVVLTCLLVSLAPALQISRAVWRHGATTFSSSGHRVRGLLLAVQIAIAVILVSSAALIARGIFQAADLPADFAFQTTSVVELTDRGGRGGGRRMSDAARLELIRTADQLGLRLGLANTPIGREGLNSIRTAVRALGSDAELGAKLLPLSAEAAGVLGLQLTHGRWAASDPGLAEAVVNQTLARQIRGDAAVIGQGITLRREGTAVDGRPFTVVGVTRDAHLTGLREPVAPTVHVAPVSDRSLPPLLLMRSTPEAESILRSVAGSAGPDVSVSVRPLRDSMRQTIEEAAIGAAIAGALGLVALALACIGVFSVFAYLVEIQRREIGIRLALGASGRQIAAALLRATSWAVAGGAIAGIVLAGAAGLVLRGFLFGLSPVDPMSHLAGAMTLGIAGWLAMAIPLRRALRVDPAVTLRAE
jgi:predicted permease